MSVWKRLAFCACGWSDEPSFGSVWFTQKHHPCCPSCGASADGYTMKTVRYGEEVIGTRKNLLRFTVPVVRWFYETQDGVKIYTAAQLALRVDNPAGSRPELIWKCQYASPHRKDGNDVVHFAKSSVGTFEIYESDAGFLLTFPKSIGLPAELFHDIGPAKALALVAAQGRGHPLAKTGD